VSSRAFSLINISPQRLLQKLALQDKYNPQIRKNEIFICIFLSYNEKKYQITVRQ
jgi:sRNA-binding regulator protein Hfq